MFVCVRLRRRFLELFTNKENKLPPPPRLDSTCACSLNHATASRVGPCSALPEALHQSSSDAAHRTLLHTNSARDDCERMPAYERPQGFFLRQGGAICFGLESSVVSVRRLLAQAPTPSSPAALRGPVRRML